MIIKNRDRFGFYKVGNLKLYSKIEAIEVQQRTGIWPQWDFNQSFFSAYNWKVEPKENLKELYARRARQIRNDYDYVVIFFSGGADSTNILNTFVQNNIKIDEVATYNYLSAESDPNSVFNCEQVKVSYPYLKRLEQQGIKFKHRPIDLSNMVAKVLTDKKYLLERAYWSNSHWGVSHLAKSYIRETIPDYQKIMESGKRLVFVWGSEKPRLYQEQGRYCLKFLDMLDPALSGRTRLLNRENEYDELFYWAPESVDIICKQGHILKNFFKIHNILTEDEYYKKIKKNNYKELVLPDIKEIFASKKTEDGLTYRNLINVLIYPDFDPGIFSIGKQFGMVYSARDSVWNEDNFYKCQYEYLFQHLSTIDKKWWNDPADLKKGLKLCVSPPYSLE